MSQRCPHSHLRKQGVGTRTNRRCRRGFSLLEVILALAVLTGAIAVLGEVVGLALRNAEVSREMTQAQLLCESKLAEITAGILVPDPVEGAALQMPEDPLGAPTKWLYSIRRENTEEQGLDLVWVTVSQNLEAQKQPVQFSMCRWIPETGVETSQETGSEDLGTEETNE